ncbi:hypothetical protein F5050DRAFT_1743426 [Lentinula boryana]|uniref:Uncharacterized protein n=1 Tax=Lentinula boryana TaxID=40481 RepID=A0ABQ8QJQ3_9AGAR|nr:hypothetical protein F5050DRAFT_1743426 [Lentinula boryana]
MLQITHWFTRSPSTTASTIDPAMSHPIIANRATHSASTPSSSGLDEAKRDSHRIPDETFDRQLSQQNQGDDKSRIKEGRSEDKYKLRKQFASFDSTTSPTTFGHDKPSDTHLASMDPRAGTIQTTVGFPGAAGNQDMTRPNVDNHRKSDAQTAVSIEGAGFRSENSYEKNSSPSIRVPSIGGAQSRVFKEPRAQPRIIPKDDEIRKFQRSIQKKDAKIGQLKQELQARDGAITNLTQSLQAKNGEIENMKQDLHGKDSEIARLHQDLQMAEVRRYTTQIAHNQELLDSRRKELQGTRAFLNTSGTHSGADIVSMVKALNAEIFQAAASITDTIVESMTGQVSSRNGSTDPSAVTNVREMLGEEPTMLLQCNMATDDHITLVQIALQAGLNHLSGYVLSLWTYPGSANQQLEQVFAGIRTKQGQFRSRLSANILFIHQILTERGVSHTWRSLTKAWAKKGVYQSPWIHGLIAEAVRALQKLDEAMTGLTFMDLALDIPAQGANFDARMMEDADGRKSSHSSSSGIILLTSELGLKDMDTSVHGRKQETSILLRPKVVLREVFSRQRPDIRSQPGGV